jgi:hypothetical protein
MKKIYLSSVFDAEISITLFIGVDMQIKPAVSVTQHF